MSHLGDLIVENGAFAPGDLLDEALNVSLHWAADLNALRDELIELRAKAEELQRRIEAQRSYHDAGRAMDVAAPPAFTEYLRRLREKAAQTGPASTLPAEQPPAQGSVATEVQRGAEAVCAACGSTRHGRDDCPKRGRAGSDGWHYDVPCVDRPSCTISEHHEGGYL